MEIQKACPKAMATIEVLEKNGIVLNDAEMDAVSLAFGKRGPYKGYLTKNKPNGNKQPLVEAAWLAMQPNPYKVSISAMIMLGGIEQDLFNKLSRNKDGKAILYPDCFDKDKETLTNCGVW